MGFLSVTRSGLSFGIAKPQNEQRKRAAESREGEKWHFTKSRLVQSKRCNCETLRGLHDANKHAVGIFVGSGQPRILSGGKPAHDPMRRKAAD